MSGDCCSSDTTTASAASAVTTLVESVRQYVNTTFEGKDAATVAATTLGFAAALHLPGLIQQYYAWKSEGKGFKGLLMAAAVSLIPAARRKLEEEQKKARTSMEHEILKEAEGLEQHLALPDRGMDKDELLDYLKKCSAVDEAKWSKGTISGSVYHGGADLTEVIAEAFRCFALANPLHPDLFPMVRKMEAEVVAMMIELMNGKKANQECCGTMTSGGTESILMACKAYRDWGRKEKGIGNGIGWKGGKAEIVAAVTVHAAFDKAADYFGMKVVHVPVDKSGKMDLKAAEAAITCRTVCLVGSAPSFPHGIVDDIEGLADIAKRYRVGLHVDSCLGGLLLPFLPAAGYDLKPWDFRVDGVTSISADTHKYGFAPKGSSVVLYSNTQLRQYQFFVNPDWTGGIYASPAIAGSRPGALVASTWAAMMKMGKDGYVQSAKKIMKCATTIREGLKKFDELELCGDSKVMVIAFGMKGKKKDDIFKVNDAMSKRKWNLNALQFPSSLHLCVTYANSGSAEKFLADLRESLDEIKANPTMYKDGASAIYGMAQSIPDRSIVTQIASTYLEVVYQP